jgi:hypothetical protein
MTSTPTLAAPLTAPAPHLIADVFAAPSTASIWLRNLIASGETSGVIALPRALRNVSSHAAARLITVDLMRQGYPQAATPDRARTPRTLAKMAALLEAADVDSDSFAATYGPCWEDVVAFTEAIDRQTRQMKLALNSLHHISPVDGPIVQIRSRVKASAGHDRLSAIAHAVMVSTPLGDAPAPQTATLHTVLGRVATAIATRDLIDPSLFESVVAPWRQIVQPGH